MDNNIALFRFRISPGDIGLGFLLPFDSVISTYLNRGVARLVGQANPPLSKSRVLHQADCCSEQNEFDDIGHLRCLRLSCFDVEYRTILLLPVKTIVLPRSSILNPDPLTVPPGP